MASPFLTMREVAVIFRYEGANAAAVARKHLHRKNMPVYRRAGRTLLVKQEDLDELINTGRCVRGTARRLRELTKGKA